MMGIQYYHIFTVHVYEMGNITGSSLFYVLKLTGQNGSRYKILPIETSRGCSNLPAALEALYGER